MSALIVDSNGTPGGRPPAVRISDGLIASLGALGVMIAGTFCAFALWPDDGSTLLLDSLILAALWFQYRYFYARRRFAFSAGFWVTAFFLFYFVVKSIEYIDDENREPGNWGLWYAGLFLIFYALAYGVSRLFAAPTESRKDLVVLRPSRLLAVTFGVFAATRLINMLMVRILLGDDYTQLEMAAATQNQGMAYFTMALGIGMIAFSAQALYTFSTGRGRWLLLVSVLILALSALSTANRSAVILLVFTLLYLYDKYVGKTRYGILLLLSPLFVLVVSFFGYVRDIEVGSSSVYAEAARHFVENPELVWQIFAQRLDVLTSIIRYLELDSQQSLPHFWGTSYLNMFTHAIPRSIWPDKPLLTAAYMSMQITPGAFADGVNFYPSVFFEGWLNFGQFGVALSGCMVGVLARIYDDWMQSASLARTVLYLSFFSAPLGLLNEGFHSNFVAGMTYTAALAALLYGILRLAGAVRIQRATPARHARS